MTSDYPDIIALRVTPKSSANKVEGWIDDANGQRWLKLRVTAPPDDGKANKAVIKLMAAHLGVPASQCEIVRGHTSRQKWLRWQG